MRVLDVQYAKPLLDKWLTDEDYEALAQGTVNAYKACDKHFRNSVVTGEFLPGIEKRSNMLNIFVMYSLFKIANEKNEFKSEFKQNAAHNCWHLRLHKGGLSITTHFLGRKNDRSMARSAKNRAVLLSKNLDLFQSDNSNIDDITHLYCHLYHGGWLRPEEICLVIPTADQSNISHAMNLNIPKPDITKAEQIREEMTFRLLIGTEETEVNAKKQAS